MKVRKLLSVLASLFLAGNHAAVAGPMILLGPSDNLAIDQPRVAVEVYQPQPEYSFGPELFNTFLLDTGANGILAVGESVDEMTARGYQVEGTFEEAGLGGAVVYDVSAPYNFDFAGTDGVRRTLSRVRIMSSAAGDLQGFDGIVGMPAMVNRVTSLDLTAMISPGGDFGVDYMGVGFPASLPADGGHRYSVPLELVEFDPGPGIVPAYSPLPYVQVDLAGAGRTASRRLVVDTGAQMSIISTSLAIAIGLDSDGDGSLEDETDTFIPVGGIGGTVNAPVLPVRRLSMPTRQGVDLAWTDLEVLALDIDPAIQGVVGMDILASGWTEPVLEAMFGGGSGGSGYFHKIHFDFRQADTLLGSMLVDVDPSRDQRVLPGDLDGDGDVDFFDQHALTPNMGWAEGATWQDGDIDGDGDVDFADYQIMETNFGLSLGPMLVNGDCDGDGDVDFADYQVLEANFGLTGTAKWFNGDFDHDGDVDSLDYQALAANYGAMNGPVPPAPIPEPTSLGILLAGASATALRRHAPNRRRRGRGVTCIQSRRRCQTLE
jgi:hypothetical protein